MSKLAERIRNATRLQPQPLGFVTARSAEQATMVLAALDAGCRRRARTLAARGADVVIVGSADAPRAAGGARGRDGRPRRVRRRSDPDEAKRFREAGFDFVIFDPDRAGATALLDEDRRLHASAARATSRTSRCGRSRGFRLDAIDIGAIAAPLTVRRQIDLQRLFALTRKPLMSRVDAGISPR